MKTSARIRKADTAAGDDNNQSASGQPSGSSKEQGLRKIVRNFTPSWFSVTMGTGIVPILLHNLPYNATWLYWVSIVFFVLNIILFAIFTLISIARYTIYPRIWGVMIRHPTQSLFLGTFPMGFATIINMIALVCVPSWGPRIVTLVWILWWIDAATSLAICLYLPFVVMYFHAQTELSTITAAWLLPVVPTIVAAASGSIIAGMLPNVDHALWTILVSYVLFGTGFPLAMTMLVIYFTRLMVHKLPPQEVIVSVFLPLGPLGQGSFAVMQLGKVSMKVLPNTSTLIPSAGETLYVLGFLAALVMWGFGLVWLFFAIASISRCKFPFNMGWWGFTFPIGVFSMATLTLGQEIPSKFFKILGTIFSTIVILLWILVAIGTVKKSMTGELFYAPCLQDLDKQKEEAAQLEDKDV